MPAYRFGPYLLDPARRELLRDGAAVQLPPKAFDVIVYLVEHRDRAVGRDELISGVWGRVDVSDNVLDQIILRARRALGDHVEPRHTIATRPRFGFAWMQPVVVVEDSGAGAAAVGPESTSTVDPASAAASAAVPARASATASDSVRWPEVDASSARQAPDSDSARARGADIVASAPDGSPTTHVPAPARTRRVRAAAVLIAALIALPAAVALWNWTRPGDPVRSAAPATGPGATLVLPFAVDPKANADWARLGLMDLVADRLRDAGVETAPSDNAVALLRGMAMPREDDAGALDALASRAGAARVVLGHIALVDGRWRVALRAHGQARGAGAPDATHTSAEAASPLDAAREAADQLAVALGHAPGGVALPDDAALALRLQQIDAAVLGDAMDVAQRLLDDVPSEQRDEPEVRLRAATLQFRRGELDEAATRFASLLDDVPASDSPHLHGTVLSALGNIGLRRGDPAEAERRGDQAIAVLGALPPSRELGRAFTGRAIARSTQGDYAAALDDFARARMLLDSIGDRLGAARVDINVGILDARRDRLAEAEPVLAAAADQLAAFNDLTNELFARVTLAQVRLGLLEPAAALAGDARLAQIVEREPSAERRRYANLTRAEVLAANGRLREADQLLAAVRTDASEDGDIVLLGVAQSLAAHWTLAQDPAAAAREAQAALNAPWEDEGPRRYAATWLVLVRSRIALDDLDGAGAALTGFEAWAARHDGDDTARSIAATLWLARAELAAASDATQDAATGYEHALAAAEATRVPAELLEVGASYAPWLLAQSEAARAGALAGRIAPWADRDYRAAVATAGLHAAMGHRAGTQAALAHARRLAGERVVPVEIVSAGD